MKPAGFQIAKQLVPAVPIENPTFYQESFTQVQESHPTSNFNLKKQLLETTNEKMSSGLFHAASISDDTLGKVLFKPVYCISAEFLVLVRHKTPSLIYTHKPLLAHSFFMET